MTTEPLCLSPQRGCLIFDPEPKAFEWITAVPYLNQSRGSADPGASLEVALRVRHIPAEH